MVKKLSLFFLNIVIAASCLNGMEEKTQGYQNVLSCFRSAPSVITQPYHPGISAQHPWLTKLSKSAFVGVSAPLIAYCGQRLFNASLPHILDSKGSLACAGIGGFLIAYLYQKYKAPNLVDTILVDPLIALKYGHKVNGSVLAEIKKRNIDQLAAGEALNEGKEIFKKFEKSCPLFLLGECTKEDWGACLLSRTYEPRYRNYFEQKVVECLLQKINDDNPIHYASFGCGGSFQDLVILTKVLAQKPDASLAIHLIDLQHSPYVQCKNFTKDGREIEIGADSSNLDLVMNDIMQDIRKELGKSVEKLDSNELEKRIKGAFFQIEEKGKQFIGWLQKTFPRANLSLALHNTADSYLKYVEDQNLPYPDIITTADIQDEMSLLRRSCYSYVKLCVKILQNKETTSNFWLLKGNDNKKVQVVSISLKEIPDAEMTTFTEDEKKGNEDNESEEVPDKKDNATKIYVKTETI